MQPTILFRSNSNFIHDDERKIASKYFKVVNQRTSCKDGLIIGRYSVLPFYLELERDLHANHCRLINSYNEHKYIADMHWLEDIRDTPKTWTDHDFYLAPEGKYVVKGRTNSRKEKWDTLMFAKDKKAAMDIAGELACDTLIGPQTLVYRQYIPLKTYEVGINGLPFTHEFRFFFYKEECLVYNYYWSNALETNISLEFEGFYFAKEQAKILAQKTKFFVIDVAQDLEGKWWLIEVNDGQMSGLSMCDPDLLYSNLKHCLEKEID